MEISFNCPLCNQHLTIDESGVGAEIPCPKCGEVLIIPTPEPTEPTPRHASEAEGGGHSVPLPPTSRGETKILKAPKPLDIAAKAIRKVRFKTFRHLDFVKDGKDSFDETVANFLSNTGEENLIGVHTIQYTPTPKESAAVTDYGVVVVYKA